MSGEGEEEDMFLLGSPEQNPINHLNSLSQQSEVVHDGRRTEEEEDGRRTEEEDGELLPIGTPERPQSDSALLPLESSPIISSQRPRIYQSGSVEGSFNDVGTSSTEGLILPEFQTPSTSSDAATTVPESRISSPPTTAVIDVNSEQIESSTSAEQLTAIIPTESVDAARSAGNGRPEDGLVELEARPIVDLAHIPAVEAVQRTVENVSSGEISPYFRDNPRSDLNGSAVDFQTEDGLPPGSSKPIEEKKKKSKGKKRKAVSSVEEENEEGSCCTICFEPWSNSGDHRIASLKCGHFFGFICIDKWLSGTGASCPNCNEKNKRKDIRVHYVSKLKAIDTSEKDRALADLEKERSQNRKLQLSLSECQLRNRLLQEEIDKYRKFRGSLPAALHNSQAPSTSSASAESTRLVYQKTFEMVRQTSTNTCRVLAYSEYLGMLVISQPSFTALAPGFGVRQYNVLHQKVGNFISLCKEQIRDLSFSRISQHMLLSCSQDKSARITNMSTGNKVIEFTAEHQLWACDWAADNDYQVMLGTQRGCMLIYDTRSPTAQPTQLNFPDGDKRPIIGIRSVPANPESGFPRPGFLVMNLASLWYWAQEADSTWSYYKLNIDQRMLFWSLDFDPDSFLILVGCKPAPLATHLILELHSSNAENSRVYMVRTLMTCRGGSFNQRSFLRSSVLPSPGGQVCISFSKGSGQTDHYVIIQEVGADRVIQQLKVNKPIVDIKQLQLNSDRHLALLGERDLIIYKWSTVQ